MEDITVQCPYCGEQVELQMERDLVGSLVQDCEVCCRPWAMQVARDEDGHALVTLNRS